MPKCYQIITYSPDATTCNTELTIVGDQLVCNNCYAIYTKESYGRRISPVAGLTCNGNIRIGEDCFAVIDATGQCTYCGKTY